MKGCRLSITERSNRLLAPIKKRTHDGSKPYTLAKLRSRAAGFVDLLIKLNKGKPKGKGKIKGKGKGKGKDKDKDEHKSIHIVADAFGITSDRLKKWRIPKEGSKFFEPLMTSYRREIARLKMSENQTPEEFLDCIMHELTNVGAKYIAESKLAHEKKKFSKQK